MVHCGDSAEMDGRECRPCLRFHGFGALSGRQNRHKGDHMHKRLLSREEAAHYCGTTPRRFTVWVERGLMPRRIPGTNRWDVRAVDAAIDRAGAAKAAPAAVGRDDGPRPRNDSLCQREQPSWPGREKAALTGPSSVPSR